MPNSGNSEFMRALSVTQGRKKVEGGQDESYWLLSKAIAANCSSRIRIGSGRHCGPRHPVDFAVEWRTANKIPTSGEGSVEDGKR